MKKIIVIFLILISSSLFAQADLPTNLSLKGIGDWTRNFQYIMSGTSGSLPTVEAKGIHYIEWSENNFPAHYISNGTNWVLQVGRLFNSGTVSAPGIAFVDDKDTGIFSDSDGIISFSTNNSNVMNVKSEEIEFLTGLRLNSVLITEWPTGGGAEPAGNESEIQYNTAGGLGANSGLTYASNTQLLEAQNLNVVDSFTIGGVDILGDINAALAEIQGEYQGE